MHSRRARWRTSRLLCTFSAFVVALGLAVALPQAAQAQTPCADLSVTGFSVAPGQPVQGQPATVSIVVRNTGTCVAQGFVVQWRTDPFGASGPSTPVVDLAANASITLSFDFTFPN